MATDFSQASISAIDAEEGVDPVAEADVYMAYGRDAQAEEILLDALKTDPTRTAIHVKLLEIYAGRKNNKQFETLASDLYAQTGGVGGDWEKAAAMGLKLDPANPLYGGAAGGQAGHSHRYHHHRPGGRQANARYLDHAGRVEPDRRGGGKGRRGHRDAGEAGRGGGREPRRRPALDFDLDLGRCGRTGALPLPLRLRPKSRRVWTSILDWISSPRRRKPAAYNPEATMVMDARSRPLPAADLALDIKLDEAAATPAAEEGLHFDLDLGASAPASQASAEVIDLEKTIAGGSALDFDFNIGAPPADKPAAQASRY
jgi:pilus assembly protein FimV